MIQWEKKNQQTKQNPEETTTKTKNTMSLLNGHLGSRSEDLSVTTG